MRRFAWVLGVTVLITAVRADVKLASIFSDNMVLQRDTEAPFWGWADAGEKVTVTGSWGKSASTVTGDDGTWKVGVKTPGAGGPFTVTVRGKNTIEYKEVLSGEVWLCSGQSNMGMTVGSSNNAKEEMAAATYPKIRLFKVHLVPAVEPQDNCKVTPWAPCSPANVGSFTAAGYFFGRKLYQNLDIPIGLINSSWGGTVIEAWTPWDVQKDDPVVQTIRASWDQRDKVYDPVKATEQYAIDRKAWGEWHKGGKQGKAPRRPRAPGQPRKDRNHPANLFNGMINPIVPFAIRGTIWYQGEGNAGRGKHYRVQMERKITAWRQLWGYDFPYYFVQLPNFKAPWKSPVENGGWPDIRESFMNTAKEVPNTGMAITIDVGDEKDIHPKNKQDVGDRLARVALHKTYGKTGFAWCGPVYETCEFRGGKAYVTFDTGGAPLAVKGGGDIVGFALTGMNGVAVRADAVIQGEDTVVVSAPTVKEAVMLHYAWANNPVGVNLANAGGLPASPFRFIPKFDAFAKLCPEEAKQYKLVYGWNPIASRLADGNTRFLYDVDNSEQVKGPFKKVAYFMALQRMGAKVTYAFVSMDPFTDDVAKIGVPSKASGARFQLKVTNAVVKTNSPNVTEGTFAEGCNIEFWDCNYGGNNAAKITNADAGVLDFGDQMSPDKSPGYGCMQIHNWQEKHAIICFNRFGSGAGNDVGIGNSEGKTRDWTFTSSGKTIARAEFKVFVLP
ncbi:MAG: 9-O-acetylesterase [Lentisphaerae bacterium]|jgi:sialate O-acetylesterase|nr:9-O-acetylesterase [Lentisphaerota bacterium]MBT4820448.1 9-O-acetylesterase [Lentisphaerota bacterium]MBT5609831.1 9-O-acetylesterase [Lentisphaerota bacterium]MBT7059869.1 9-O-acetylesterase [Lentisphaerota bacterium]MBT7848310.1 9-O-acetylesterase [Lentisphaerota bacterium]